MTTIKLITQCWTLKKMINKGELLLLSDMSTTWATFRGH